MASSHHNSSTPVPLLGTPFNTISCFSDSIVTADNDPNWEDVSANPITNNNTANRPTFSTCSWSKPCQSDNTNKQLADILG